MSGDEPPVIPRIAGRFAPGAPGRPKGSRNKLGEAFVKALADDFEEYGIATIATVRQDDPATYLKVIAGLLPKEITGEDGSAIPLRIERVIIDPKN